MRIVEAHHNDYEILRRLAKMDLNIGKTADAAARYLHEYLGLVYYRLAY